MARSETLLRQDGFGIFAHRQDSPAQTLIITFGDISSSLTERGFGTDWALKLGHDTVYVAQARRSQYQHLSRETFARTLAPLAAGYDRVVCYGSSVGGYCAFYFGGAIRSEILAAAPRLPRHPILNAPRSRDLPFLHEEFLPPPEGDCIPLVILDPLTLLDARFLFQYAGPRYPKMHLCPIPGAGHLVLKRMAEAGVLSRLLPPMVEGRMNSLPRWAKLRLQAHLAQADGMADEAEESA
ncbi:hypothetical protein [Gemmobacter denitrificans]|uniref:Alpha/beta hydrolase n=1 Tax=Gemmobacter denitrificans TaxID=3123040 RepID=A0ABU8BVE8_9RHOB